MRPIFVGGCARSGTTLLGAMLGAHSECLCVPESQFMIELLRSYNWNKDQVNMPYILSTIKNHWRFRVLWGLVIEPASVSYEELIPSYPGLVEWLVKMYGKKVGKSNPRFWIDHTPLNIRYAATLSELFPEAKMIHLVRDGRGVASSVIPLDWGPNTVTKAAHWWVEHVAYGLAVESSLEENQIMRVRYEDMISNPEATLRELCSYLEIDYQPEIIKARGFKVPSYQSAEHALIGKEPDRNRLNAWEKELTPRQVEIFEGLTFDFLRYLGYPLKYGLKAKKLTAMEWFRSYLREMYFSLIVNKYHFWNRARKSRSSIGYDV